MLGPMLRRFYNTATYTRMGRSAALLLLAAVLAGGCSRDKTREEAPVVEYTQTSSVRPLKDVTYSAVWVCTGRYATRYHKSSRCRGLNRCRGGIVKRNLSDVQKSGLTPCRICY